MRSLRRGLRWLERLAVAAACIGFAAQNGLQYGRSNHLQYLLHGLHAADPAFLQNDWFTTQTPSHHRLLNSLVEAAARTGRPDVALGLANGLMGIAFAAAIFFLVARFTTRPVLPFVALLVLAANMGIDGPGHSNILLPYFVPSVFGGVALLASMVCLLYDRYWLAGLIAAAGGMFHGNYQVLIGPLWVLVLVLDRRPADRRRMIALLLPWLAAWIPQIGMFSRIAASPVDVASARHIFWEIYAPFHYRPRTWAWRQTADFLLVLGAGGLCTTFLIRQSRGVASREHVGNRPTSMRTGRALVLSLFAIVGLGAVFTAVWPVDIVTAVYTWRLAPFLSLAAFLPIALLAGSVKQHRFGIGDEEAGGRWPPIVVCAAVGLAALLCLYLTRMNSSVCLWLAAVGIVTMAGAVCQRYFTRRGPMGVRIVHTAVLVVAALTMFRAGLWRRDMFHHPYKEPVESLFAWARENTAAGTIFVIPPELDCAGFRLETGRAVVVDWKCMPLLPESQIEWHRRHERQAGRAVQSEADAVAGYRTLDAERARLLARDFGCRYVVIDHQVQSGELSALARVFQGRRFDVYEIPSHSARSCAGDDVPSISLGSIEEKEVPHGDQARVRTVRRNAALLK